MPRMEQEKLKPAEQRIFVLNDVAIQTPMEYSECEWNGNQYIPSGRRVLLENYRCSSDWTHCIDCANLGACKRHLLKSPN